MLHKSISFFLMVTSIHPAAAYHRNFKVIIGPNEPSSVRIFFYSKELFVVYSPLISDLIRWDTIIFYLFSIFFLWQKIPMNFSDIFRLESRALCEFCLNFYFKEPFVNKRIDKRLNSRVSLSEMILKEVFGGCANRLAPLNLVVENESNA